MMGVGAAALWQTSVRTLVLARCRHTPVTRLAMVASTKLWNRQRGLSSLDKSTRTEQEQQQMWEGRLKDAWKLHNNISSYSDNPDTYVSSLEQVRDAYVNLGSWEDAFAMEEQLLKYTDQDKREQTADAYHRMGSLQLQMQHFGEARRYYQLALGMFYDLHGRHVFHRDMGKMLIGLGGICVHQGDPAEALPFLAQAEMHYANHGMCVDNNDDDDNNNTVPPDPHPEISVVFNNQALIYRMMGQHHVAIEKYKKILAFCEKFESDNEEKRDHIQLQIADCLFAVNQLSPALEYFQTLLQNELRRRCGGEENYTAQEGMLRHHIGVIHSKQGRMEEALRELESAYVINKATLGEMHQDVASTLNALGAVHASIGNDGEALSYFRESLMIARIHAGPKGDEDLQVMQTLRNISLVHGDKVPKWN